LRAHTTNNNAGVTRRSLTRHSAVAAAQPHVDTHEACRRAAQLGAGVIISALFGELSHLSVAPPASRPAPNLKADTFTASILRTHSQCQRGSRTLP